MQNRPQLENQFRLKERFSGWTDFDSGKLRIQSGDFLDFQGSRNKLHRHSYYELCLVLSGRGSFVHDKTISLLEAGDIFIADPGVIHEIISHETDHLKIQFLSFSFEENPLPHAKPSGLTAAFIKKHNSLVRNCNDLEELFLYMKAASFDEDPGRAQARSLAAAELIIRDVILRSTNFSGGETSHNPQDNRLQVAVQYIKDNPFRKLDIVEVASHAGASTRTLRRLFQAEYGKTIISFCREQRIKEAAKNLIAHPEDSISRISEDSGFENTSDFCRAFKKEMGCTPGSYRRGKGTVFPSFI